MPISNNTWDMALYGGKEQKKALKYYVFKKRLKRLIKKLKQNSVALVRERTIPTERPPPVGEVSANFCG
jgi:hypothetical protein